MRPIKLLVADDSEDDVVLLTTAFEIVGSSVAMTRVADGAQAYETLRSDAALQYDLITLDYYLPRKNALEILEGLDHSGVGLRLPVVVLSSGIPLLVQERLRKLGAALICEKPNDLDRLCTLASDMLQLVKT